MPKPQWRDTREVTAFARLIREGYMWRQMPPLSVSDLAERTGIPKQTIFGWLSHGAKPRRSSLQVLHRVTGIPVEELLEAAGYGNPVDDALHVVRREWRDRFSPAVLDQVIAHMRGVLEVALNNPTGDSATLPLPTLPTQTEPSEHVEPSR